MEVKILVGDILEVTADVIVCSANPWLNLSGGVGGALLARAGETMQAELHRYLAERGMKAAPAGSVVPTSGGGLPARTIIHAVAIDPFYESSIELVRMTLRNCLELAASLGAESIAIPALATGYGRLPIEDFSAAAAPLLAMEWAPITTMIFVARAEEYATAFAEIALKRQS